MSPLLLRSVHLIHLLHILAVVFFWTLGIAFFAGMLGCLFVIIYTTVDDVKELLEREERPPNRVSSE